MNIRMQCFNEKRSKHWNNPLKFPTSDNLVVFSTMTMYNSAKKVSTNVIKLNLKISLFFTLKISIT